MASSNLALRMSEIEAKLERLAQKLESREKEAALPWWEQRWGVFDNSPDYDKAMEMGRKYRESLCPKPAKDGVKKKAAKAEIGKTPTLQVEDWAA